MIEANKTVTPDVQVMYVGESERVSDELRFCSRWSQPGTVIALSCNGEIAHVVWGDPLYRAGHFLTTELMPCP